MEAHLFTSLFVCLCVSQLTFSSLSFEDFLSDEPWPSLPECGRVNEPCDYALKTISSRPGPNGEMERKETIYETTTEICTCPGGNTCPRGWDTAPGKTITRSLLSTGKEVQYKLNYCTAPPTERTCENEEIAVVMSGVLYPDVVDTVNCACPNNEYNLHLKRAYFVSPFRISHEFVCRMRTCNMNTSDRRVCKKIKKNRVTEYRCMCPENYECRMEPAARKGYCERRATN